MVGFIKDPDAALDYTLDWGPWLNGDTISTSTWIIASGAGVTFTGPGAGGVISSDSTQTTVWLDDGVLDENADVTNRITTVAGRTDDRTIVIKVRPK